MRATPAVRALTAFLAASLSGCLYFSTERQIDYGLTHYHMGLYDRAIPPLMTAAESMEKESPPDPRLVDVLIALGTMATSEHREDLAADFYPRALKAAEAVRPVDDKRLRNALVNLGTFYADDADRPLEAIPLLERAAAISSGFDYQVFHAIDLDNLGLAYQNSRQYAEASEYSLKALAVVEPLTTGKDRVQTKGVILYNLAMSYAGQGEPWRVKTVRLNYADFLRRTGRAKQADELESKSKRASGR